MKLQNGYWQTYKEIPSEAEIPSHQLMLRAGMIYKAATGLYAYLPMGLRVLRKIERIIREEMDRIGSHEIEVPIVTPAELWKETKRWDKFGPTMLRFKSRSEREFCFSPTNEESVVDIFRMTVKSYKQLPLTLYQINNKFRDEVRPRYGVMRACEFSMKDAYSFHIDKSTLDATYDDMYNAYKKILERMELKYIIAEADGGAMASSGSRTHEFQVIAKSGEDRVIKCTHCDYAANVERADTKKFVPAHKSDLTKTPELIDTPNRKSIEEVSSFFNVAPSQCLKSIVYWAIRGDKEEALMAVVYGDDSINEIKLKAIANCDHLTPWTDADFKRFEIANGFVGPYKLNTNTNTNLKLEIIFDSEINVNENYVAGGQTVDKHYLNVVPSRDIDMSKIKVHDIRESVAGDLCKKCGKTIEEQRGIEVGHVFQLGDLYTKAMNVTVLDKDGKVKTPIMGCYGIGVSRLIAAAIEQWHDEKGIVWPKAIAPYQVYLAVISKNEEFTSLCEKVYNELQSKGVEVIFDDRNVGPGFKFKDAELIGIPTIVVMGERDYNETKTFEIRDRKTNQSKKVIKEELLSELLK